MIYKGISWACILFGLILFGSSYELLKYQQNAGEIVAMIMVGVMGSVIIVMGLFGLWELRRKKA
tara:strand:+ start:3115 stop:3306 length:192 start_codon:yes stop_codon:yes gene_type:complete